MSSDEYPQRLKDEIGELLGVLIDEGKTKVRCEEYVELGLKPDPCRFCNDRYRWAELTANKLEKLAKWALESKQLLERK